MKRAEVTLFQGHDAVESQLQKRITFLLNKDYVTDNTSPLP